MENVIVSSGIQPKKHTLSSSKKVKVSTLPKRNAGFARNYVTITDDLFEEDLR